MRFELHGSIGDYFRAAANHAAQSALFITVYPTQYLDRVLDAANETGFSIKRRVDMIPREGKPPLFSLFTCMSGTAGNCLQEVLVVRKSDQFFTDEFRAVRRLLGFRDKTR